MSAMNRPQGKLRNCKACGKVFVSMAGEKYCPKCLPLEEEKRRKIDNYLREHPGAPVIDVVREARLTGSMGNSHEVEDYMFVEGLVDGVPKQNFCASCGAPIADGLTYCKTCFQLWMRTVKGQMPAPRPIENYNPYDPDRAAAVDVATLKRQAMYGSSKPNRPHGPEHKQTDEDEQKLRRYRGIVERG